MNDDPSTPLDRSPDETRDGVSGASAGAALVARLAAPVALLDGSGRIVAANAAFRSRAGEGASLADVRPAGFEGAELRAAFAATVAGGASDVRGSDGSGARFRSLPGGGVAWEWTPAVAPGSGGRVEELEARARAFDALSSEGVLIQGPDLRVTYASERARRILGVAEDDLLGRSWGEAPLEVVREDGARLLPDEHPSVRAVATRRPAGPEVLGRQRPSGGLAWIEVASAPLLRPGEARPHGALSVVRDVTEARLQRERLRYRERHDALTDLPNRDAFFELVGTEMRREDGGGSGHGGGGAFAVVLVGLDGFQGVNDAHGHAVGDAVLARAARRLERCIRPEDAAARLGGDEFAVLLRDVGAQEDALRVVERLLQELRAPYHLPGQVVGLSASLGVTLAGFGCEAARVVGEAEYALRHAKRAGRNRYSVYTEALSRDRRHGNAREAEIVRGLERGEFAVVYQPILDAKEQRLSSVEALLRWEHPERGPVGPDEFIPVAERSGAIVPLGEWMIRTALAQLAAWSAARPGLRVALNLSAKQLEIPDLDTLLAGWLREAGVSPRDVVLEITESVAMRRLDDTAALLHRLAGLGAGLAVDDFGTGYSSLGYLQHLPFSVVKIDRSFLRDVPDDRRNTALVRTIIAMAQALNLQVVAEGVETQTQAFFLYWEGATWVQGFHFGRPMPAGELERRFLEGEGEAPLER